MGCLTEEEGDGEAEVQKKKQTRRKRGIGGGTPHIFPEIMSKKGDCKMEHLDIQNLRRRAKKHGFRFQKDSKKPYDAWYIVKNDINGVVSNGSLDLASVADWLDDFETE